MFLVIMTILIKIKQLNNTQEEVKNEQPAQKQKIPDCS